MGKWGQTVPRGTDEARLRTVIETKSLKGDGSKEDPCRFLFQYWDFNGKLLAEWDSIEGAIKEE